jgi:hypothetical protein
VKRRPKTAKRLHTTEKITNFGMTDRENWLGFSEKKTKQQRENKQTNKQQSLKRKMAENLLFLPS